MKHEARAFKCTRQDSTYHAWCKICAWSTRSGGTKNSSPAANRKARQHTIETGHETRIDATSQRGYRAVDLVSE